MNQKKVTVQQKLSFYCNITKRKLRIHLCTQKNNICIVTCFPSLTQHCEGHTENSTLLSTLFSMIYKI